MKIKAETRKIDGFKVKSLRKQGLIPSVVFGNGNESVNIQVKSGDFNKLYSKTGETEVIEIEIDNKSVPVLVDEIQYHPVNNAILHVSFREINLKVKVKVNIPIEYTGEEEHPLLKNNNAIFITLINEIEVEALPNDLPSEVKISIESLKEIGDVLTIKDIEKVIDTSKVEITEEDKETPIAKLDFAEMKEVITEERTVDDVEAVHGSAKEEEQPTTEKDKKKDSK